MIIIQDFFMITPPSSGPKVPQGEITFGDVGKPMRETEETTAVPPSPEPDQHIVTPLPDGGSIVKSSNPWPKRFIILFILVLLLGGAAFAGKWIFSMVQGGKEVTITYWGLWETDAVVRPVISAFEADHPKVKVQYVKQSPKQYRERLQAAIGRGEGPDVFRFHNTWVPMLQQDLSAVPETVMTVTNFQNTFYPVAANDLVAGNTIYGIPLEIDGLGLYYNEDLFALAGVTSAPTSWEELLAIVPKIAKPEGDTFAVSAIALGTTNNVEHYSDIVATMFMQNGASLTNLSGSEAEETLLFYRKFAIPSDALYTWNETMDNSIYAFAIGKVAMILAPSWRAFDIHDINPNLRFKIAPIPQLPGNTVNWASYWVEGVSTKSKYPKQAWEFVKFLTSKEGATLLYSEAAKSRKLFGEPYARIDLAGTLTNDPYVGAFVQQGQNARSFPLASRTFDNGLNDKLIVYLENALNGLKGGSSPTEELETMSAGFRQVFASYNLQTSSPPATNTQK